MQRAKSTLIIDGEFLLIEFKKHSILTIDEAMVDRFVKKIAEFCDSEIQNKYFFIAKEKITPRDYEEWKKCNVEVDIRPFKKKNMECPKCKVEIYKKVQAEVDVAIAIRIAKEVYRTAHQIDEIILVGGDRDFNDAIDLARERDINLVIFGGDENVSLEIQQKQGVRLLLYLPQIIESLKNVIAPVVEVQAPMEEVKEAKESKEK